MIKSQTFPTKIIIEIITIIKYIQFMVARKKIKFKIKIICNFSIVNIFADFSLYDDFDDFLFRTVHFCDCLILFETNWNDFSEYYFLIRKCLRIESIFRHVYSMVIFLNETQLRF